MKSKSFQIRSRAREEILLITKQVNESLGALTDDDGICTIFTPHTTAALAVNENADPDVPADLVRGLKALVPSIHFDHGEGNSDAHLLSSIIGVSLQVPYRGGRLRLGRWQGIYFIELDGPREREVEVYV